MKCPPKSWTGYNLSNFWGGHFTFEDFFIRCFR